jgi:hypothetical protein
VINLVEHNFGDRSSLHSLAMTTVGTVWKRSTRQRKCGGKSTCAIL